MNRQNNKYKYRGKNNKEKPIFDGLGSKKLQLLKANARADKRDRRKNGWDYYSTARGASEPVTHFKMRKPGIDHDDRFNPGLYHKISESSMQKYGIHRLNEKNSTAKKRKQGARYGEKGVYW